MNVIIFVPAFIVFLYALYKLVKDDYVFIRRNISSEQMFDIAFTVTWMSLIISRLFSFIMNPFAGKNIFLSFFSLAVNDFSLLGLVLGGICSLYLIGRYKKLPINRLYDFFTVSFTIALPVAFLSLMFFFREYILFLYFINTLVYAFFAYYFTRYFRPKLAVFLFFFSLISLADSIAVKWLQKSGFVSIENILFVILMSIGIVLFIGSRGAKPIISRKAQ